MQISLLLVCVPRWFTDEGKQSTVYYCKIAVKSSLKHYFSSFNALNLLSCNRISSQLWADSRE